MSGSDARLCMSAAGVGVLIGALCSGFNGVKWTETPRVMRLFGFSLCSSLLVFVAIVPSFGLNVLFPLSVAFGIFVGSINVLSNAALHRIVDSSLIGTAMGTINTILFFAVLVTQWVSGIMLEYVLENFSSRGSGFAYSCVFILISIFSFAALFYFSRIKDYKRETQP